MKQCLPASAIRLPRSMTSWLMRTWLSTSRSIDEAMTSPRTMRAHLGDFFRPLVDEQHDQVDLRMIRR